MNISNLGLQIFHFLDLQIRPYFYFSLRLEWMNIWDLACRVLPRGRGQQIFISLRLEWMNPGPMGWRPILAGTGQRAWKWSEIAEILCFPCVFHAFPSKIRSGNGPEPWIFIFLPLEWMNIWSPAGISQTREWPGTPNFYFFYPSNEWISGARRALNPVGVKSYPNE